MNRSISSLIFSVILLSLPLAIWAEHTEPKTWQQRLILPAFSPEPNRHTPRYTDGTFLPPVIKTSLELGPSDNPILLTGTTRIVPNATVTISPGTHIFAHEFAQLLVEGQLIISGQNSQPVLLTTNEVHPENQVWGGIVFKPGSQGQITHAQFQHASPAISCLADSTVIVDNTRIAIGETGIYTESDQCAITNSSIQGTHSGIVTSGAEPQVINTLISATHNEIKQVKFRLKPTP